MPKAALWEDEEVSISAPSKRQDARSRSLLASRLLALAQAEESASYAGSGDERGLTTPASTRRIDAGAGIELGTSSSQFREIVWPRPSALATLPTETGGHPGAVVHGLDMGAVAAIQFPDEGGRRARLGRPRGSTGSQIDRNKHQLAVLVVSGKRNGQIAKALGVCAKTIRAWLGDPEVQQEIWTVEQEYRRRTERQLMRLFRKSIPAMEDILKHADRRTKLRAIEMVWIALGRLPPKGARITLCNHNHLAIGTARRPQPGSLGSGRQLDGEDYEATVRMIRAERERMECEEAEKGEQRDRPAE